MTDWKLDRIKSMLSGKSGDYEHLPTDEYLCVAFENGEPKIIGGYSLSACLQDKDFGRAASRRIWNAYVEAG